MTVKAVRTWAETTRKANAMEEVIAAIARYMPPDSGLLAYDCLDEIIRIIETRTGHHFVSVEQTQKEG